MTTESEAPLAWPFRIPVLRVFLLPFVQTRKRDHLLLILLGRALMPWTRAASASARTTTQVEAAA